jgi:exosortase/archaeosortase family protein
MESPPPPPTTPASPQPAPTSPRGTILKFVGIFAGCVAIYYAASATSLFRQTLFPTYLKINARITATVLTAFGQATRADDHSVIGRRFTIQVERGCDAIEPTILFLAAVLASPVAWRKKIPGLIVGALALAVINIVRLATLYLTGIYWPAAFEVMHVDVWQAIFIFLALLFWVVWALWALKQKPARNHVAP